MPRCSNAVVCIANFLTILIAVPLTCFGLWMKSQAGIQCQRNIPWLFIITGIVLLVLSLCGIFGSCCRLNFFLWIYLFLMFLLIVAVTVSIAFSFVVTSRRAGDVMSEFKLGNSSSWFQRWATKNWDVTESCMKETRLCNSNVLQLLDKNNTTTGLILKNSELYDELSPIQIGCCRPPTDCDFTYVNSTYWEVPKSGITSTDGDCKVWSNSQDGMCYGCESCKAGMVVTARRNLRLNARFSTGILVFLIIIYSIGCCAFRNNRADKYNRYY